MPSFKQFKASFYLIMIFTLYTNVYAQDFCYTPTRAEGRCVPYNECKFVTQQYERFRDQVPPQFVSFLMRSRCTNKNSDVVHICCAMDFFKGSKSTTPATTTTTERSFTSNKDYQSRFNPRGLALINQKGCGIPSYQRISNGDKTELAEFPWMALLIYQNPNQPFQCGGSLINNRYVLTAAHCLIGLLDKLTGVRLGEYDTKSYRDCGYVGTKFTCLPAYEDFAIERQIPHPGYSKTTISNDVALLRLNRNVEYKVHIKPICLPTTLISSKPLELKYTIAGWGLTESKSESSILLKAELDHKSRSVCQNTFKKVNINQNHICAGGDNGKDSCHGDSGGPLFSKAELDGRPQFVQFGVVSFGVLVCTTKTSYPGIYSNLIETLPWITDNIV